MAHLKHGLRLVEDRLLPGWKEITSVLSTKLRGNLMSARWGDSNQIIRDDHVTLMRLDLECASPEAATTALELCVETLTAAGLVPADRGRATAKAA